MSNSFKKIKDIVEQERNLGDFLLDASLYLAHKNIPFESETLEEHISLVNKHFVLLVESSQLDCVIDKLISDFLITNKVDNQRVELLGDFLKMIFAKTIIFHDYGKINPNFQGNKDKMDNDVFKSKMIPNYILQTHHSKLGAYIYLVKHFKDTILSGLKPSEQQICLLFTLFLSYSILKHHSSKLEFINSKNIAFDKEELEAMTVYLKNYQIEIPAQLKVLESDVFSSVQLENKIFKPFTEHKIIGDFPLYALTRLNFSLLTASDYLATSEYMNQKPLESLGLIDEELRNKIILAAETSHSYNQKAYQLAISDFVTHNPEERTSENLNIIRQNMAVEVLRSVREHTDKRLFYLEAPTGGGKTNLSMLITAELLKANKEINKVFYVFPFTTLITQTHKAILKTLNLSENEVSLLHSKAGFQTTEEDDDYGDKKKDYLNNLFVHYPVCLLTHIRFFDILKTNEKETNYLLHRLANSIVILDELQSYPPHHWDKMLYFIQNYAESFNIKFVLMSATLPRIDKLNLPIANKPEFIDLLPNAKQYFRNANFADRVNFKFDYRDSTLEIDELAEIVLAKSEEYLTKNNKKGVFTIIEFIFKKSATEFEEAINGRFFDEGCIFVLSGTILESRRREIINFLKNEKNRDKKVLLITTQVVEAGVDIDMDLGFKNVSLIDSDEQLAGRVNRNVKKEPCDVYLFQKDKPGILYQKDKRYSVARDNISSDEHHKILKFKKFEQLYDLVFPKIDWQNKTEHIKNFNSYLSEIQRLDYYRVYNDFQIIENQNLSVFIPICLPIKVVDEQGNFDEKIFNDNEIIFLGENNVEIQNGEIDGKSVWAVYFNMINNKNKDFIKGKIDSKIITGIISKFTFSVFYSPKIKTDLLFYTNKDLNFENYLYLQNYSDCYTLERGLIEKRLNDSANFIL